MGVFSNDDIEWNGSSEGIGQNHTSQDYLEINQNFVLTMIMVPCLIISGIVIWDKRKRYAGGMKDMRKRK